MVTLRPTAEVIHVQSQLVLHPAVDLDSIALLVDLGDVVVDQQVVHPNRCDRVGHALEMHAVAAAFAGDLHDGEIVETVGARPVLVRGHVGVGVHVQSEALAVGGRVRGF
jgi:hypothetical protein